MSPEPRLLNSRSIAVISGGAWCDAVVAQPGQAGFGGPLWRIHPNGGEGVYHHIEDLPAAPDAVFIGINRHAKFVAVKTLCARGTGGGRLFCQ